jgi:predicted unusual protein kinase regulating ubiquinone biosynthesis (AarF/ABC1/UbiB family)
MNDEVIEINTNNKKSFSILLNDLLILGESYGLIIPVQFLLLIKTLMVTEANAKNLNSNLDLATVATSILFKHFKDHIK